jgi:hypothetical protein
VELHQCTPSSIHFRLKNILEQNITKAFVYQFVVVIDAVDGFRGEYDVISVTIGFFDQGLLQVGPISGEKSGRDFGLKVEQNVGDGYVLDHLIVVVLKKK